MLGASVRALVVGAQVRCASSQHAENDHPRSFSLSPFAPLSDPEWTHTEFACWMSGALEGIPPSFSSDHDDWARAIDHVESPQRSHSKRRTIWKGDPICQCKPIRSPLAQEPTNNKSSPPNGGAWRAVLPEPVSCNGGESLCSVSRRRNSSVQILSRF